MFCYLNPVVQLFGGFWCGFFFSLFFTFTVQWHILWLCILAKISVWPLVIINVVLDDILCLSQHQMLLWSKSIQLLFRLWVHMRIKLLFVGRQLEQSSSILLIGSSHGSMVFRTRVCCLREEICGLFQCSMVLFQFGCRFHWERLLVFRVKFLHKVAWEAEGKGRPQGNQ